MRIIDNTNALRDLFRDTCKYFEISAAEGKFVSYSKKLGFIIPELADKRDVYVDEEEVSTEYYLQEILNELYTKRERVIDINSRSVEGKIVVSELTFAGTVVTINGLRHTLHSEYKNVTIKRHQREIRILSNKI